MDTPVKRKISPRDLLTSRPPRPLPTCEDPKKPRGEPADPRPAQRPRPGDIDYTA